MASGPPPKPGVFGKLPALGDFVRRRLPASFVEPWDGWLQAGMAQSRSDLGEAWLAHYLTSPIWRFVLSDGACGETAAAGVVLPSVDAVNRHYPLTVAVLLPETCAPFALVLGAQAWFGRCEDLALACLRPDFDPAALETLLDEADAPAEDAAANDDRLRPAKAAGETHLIWETDLAEAGAPVAELLAAVADRLAAVLLGRYSLWWTTGSDDLAPSFHVWRGLPAATEYASLLCSRPAPRTGGPPCRPAGEAAASLQPEAPR